METKVTEGDLIEMKQDQEEDPLSMDMDEEYPKIDNTPTSHVMSEFKETQKLPIDSSSKDMSNKHLENRYLPKSYAGRKKIRPPSPYIKDGDREVPLKLLALNQHMRKMVDYLMDNKNEKLTHNKIKEMKIRNLEEVKKKFNSEGKINDK
jgi:hypothetical protein